jgi:hypothetical protein
LHQHRVARIGGIALLPVLTVAICDKVSLNAGSCGTYGEGQRRGRRQSACGIGIG